MLQLVYISTAQGAPVTAEILDTSRRNNRRDAITGLLYADGVRFLQVLEGPDEAVRRAVARIKADPRHRAVVVLSERTVDGREFGAWDMAERGPGDGGEGFIARVDVLTAHAAPAVRATFASFARIDRAA